MSDVNIELADSTFQDQIDRMNGGIVLFYKEVCPHCKALKKVLEKIKPTLPVTIAQINSEKNPEAMEKFEISRVPTLLVIKEGKMVAKKPGLMNLRQLSALYQGA